jgi:hypothetical protein
LTALRASLEVAQPYSADDPQLGELVATVCKLFVQRPAARAAARQAWLHEAQQDGQWQMWVQAAQRLRKRYPALAALEPEVLARLADSRALASEKAQLQRSMRKAARAAPTAASGQGKASWWWLPAAIMACSMCFRAMNWGPSTPRQPLPEPVQFNRDINADFLENLRKQQRERKKGEPQFDLAKPLFGDEFVDRVLVPKDKPVVAPKDQAHPP